MNERGTDIKIFKYLAYLPLMWIIGFISPYKNEKDVRFHVGQGMILNIVIVILIILVELINNIIIKNLFCTEQIILGVKTGVCVLMPIGRVLISTFRITSIGIYLFYSIYGLYNVYTIETNKLPIIGKYAFYK